MHLSLCRRGIRGLICASRLPGRVAKGSEGRWGSPAHQRRYWPPFPVGKMRSDSSDVCSILVASWTVFPCQREAYLSSVSWPINDKSGTWSWVFSITSPSIQQLLFPEPLLILSTAQGTKKSKAHSHPHGHCADTFLSGHPSILPWSSLSQGPPPHPTWAPTPCAAVPPT